MTGAITLRVDGMTCGACAEHIRQALEKVPGVRSAAVSYPQRRAEIRTDASTGLDAAPLIAAVSAIGYLAQAADIRQNYLDNLNQYNQAAIQLYFLNNQ